MRPLFAAIIAVALSSCADQPVERQPTVTVDPPKVACAMPWIGVEAVKERGGKAIEIAVTDAGDLVRLYNETPPASDVHPDRIYIVRRGQSPGIVLLIVNGCIEGHFPVTPEVIALLSRGGV